MIEPYVPIQLMNGIMVVLESARLAGVVGWAALITVLAAIAVWAGREFTG